MAALRSQGYIVLATATSGVAACALPGGRTAHSRFKLPFHDETFGDKVVVFGGDFRQVLPVVTRAGRQEQLSATLFNSSLWPYLTKIQLTQNMRSIADPFFTQYLLRIGNGTEPQDENSNIILPTNITIPFTDEDTSLQQLFHFVYPDMRAFIDDYQTVMNRALLAPTNGCVDDLNAAMLNKMDGEITSYISTDVTIDPQHQGDYEDFLNSLNPSSLPSHELLLKVNSPVMLLRNLSPIEGLCNGTRLICKELKKQTIVVEIATGPYAGQTTILHKIPLESSNNDKSGIPFKRYQFPVRLCYAMTINKAQGQTLDRVGIYLREPIFSHGQLYVAFSRVRKFDALKVLIAPPTFLSVFRPMTL